MVKLKTIGKGVLGALGVYLIYRGGKWLYNNFLKLKVPKLDKTLTGFGKIIPNMEDIIPAKIDFLTGIKDMPKVFKIDKLNFLQPTFLPKGIDTVKIPTALKFEPPIIKFPAPNRKKEWWEL